jgi:ribosome-binding factor A
MSVRTERVSGLIKEEISAVLAKDIDTSEYGLLTVTDVIMTPDLRLAKIYVSGYGKGKSPAEVLEFFTYHEKKLRMAIGRNIRLKFTPELKFYIDETLDRVQRLEELFKQIHKNDAAE